MFSLKPGGIRTRAFCSWGWRDAHRATPRHFGIYLTSFELFLDLPACTDPMKD
jgi:hypothetical protein